MLIQALSTLKLKSASVMIWSTIFLCSKIVGGDAVFGVEGKTEMEPNHWASDVAVAFDQTL